MMIDKRLIGTVRESKKYIAGNVAFQWLSLAANIVLMAAVARLLQSLYAGTAGGSRLALTALIAAAAVAVRFACTAASSRMSFLSSKAVKKLLREKIYGKLLRLGSSYREQVNTSEVVQMAVEGVDQLETYFGSYLPQLFYAMLAPLTLFAVLGFVNLPSAVLLLICVPLIPVTIVLIQRWAKKLLSRYWGQYTALGVILASAQLQAGRVDLSGCILIILLAADFFLPMRMLGSYFHIAMNGMAASDKIFRLLDLPEPPPKTVPVPETCSILCKDLHFSYEEGREILRGVDMAFPQGSFTAIVGESGCGKSTIASILMGRNQGYSGSVSIGGVPLRDIAESSLMEHLTYISHQSYLFKGTVGENLRMASPNASDDALWQVLEQVNLSSFLRSQQGLDAPLLEKGGNLSGGQRQRLALARALLHNSPVYIFDEATSNIDVESENEIMAQIHALARTKTVILISHRLANVTQADTIYVLENGVVAESGRHAALLARNGPYARLWNTQQTLETFTQGGAAE